ncbi:hypothetical protein ERO13_A03G114200v2 [Gossypium hirsutum]|uniref:Uncharacterized protein LOC107942780 n=5 Tax=Gossypium TaxID=3633 RepID=A0A1U8N2H2_GOSHI|nr:uncharacterized protein LOC107942780 [Gossypium hirsutum]XP_016731988.1 uncharacterized protein LOC107942780 [Gossypium hirsutum]XP_016731989.1 uncharacterized protein LOC107942780 [Gossypium hirsutum]KAB2090476.1 hypothetical protein ES319_A03G125700v1 [Gossypium barbadense]TYH25084.1 hypothetical protein ES288_A03G140900v1 [Gossypium darwinii]TYJ43078.1 hypothetical protein E1A91_A03G129600v1 [Gossypium mustelinum]KAB2090477.1 hypothetical protein ES319_A03G125700v1 [Gossypium barbadense
MGDEEEERRELNLVSKKDEEESESSMTPWEQHAKVISIPRFDYKAPSSLLQRSHSGFLITCTIKREKSATKEAMAIFSKYVGPFNGDDDTLGCSGNSDANADTKRRKIYTEEIDQNIGNSVDNSEITDAAVGGIPKDDCFVSAKMDKSQAPEFVLSLVKLTRSGLLLLIFPWGNSLDTIDVVSNIFCDLESGSLKSPLWCHRIFPIQATCTLNEKELQAVVSKLVFQFVNDKRNKLAQPIKFAVGFNRRGTEESQMKTPKDASKNSDMSVLLDRNKCFGAVAAAVKGIVSDSVVDLKSPELSILVELLPLSGVPNGSLLVGVSVLPQNLVSTKPRLCIKPLVCDKNGKKAS